jgi:hypothetical protein
MDILLALVVSAACITSFLIGARVGQKTAKGEEVKMPELNPFKAYREHEARREAEKEQEKVDVIMRNIESYDGTGRGQEDVPRG